MAKALIFLSVLALAGGSCRRPDPYPIRVACVGDSITEGVNIVLEGKSTYPEVLEALSGDQWDVRNFGVGGASVLQQGDRPYRRESAYLEALAFKPHAVIIQLGSNDSKPNNWVHSSRFAPDYKALIRSFQVLETRPKVWICCPTPAFSPAHTIYNRVIRDQIRGLVQDVGCESGVPVIDLYAELEHHGDLFPDGVHPNAEGARRIAKAVYRTIAADLAPETTHLARPAAARAS